MKGIHTLLLTCLMGIGCILWLPAANSPAAPKKKEEKDTAAKPDPSNNFWIGLRLIQGANFEAEHGSTKGVDSTGAVITVPKHRHEIKLNFTRIELEFFYRIKDDLAWGLQVPFEVKWQRSTLHMDDPATPLEIDAMNRNLRIHHAAEQLEGLSDIAIYAANTKSYGHRMRYGFHIKWGLWLPTGRTEPNPLRLGNLGLKHEHLQFGNGTFDPLIDATYFYLPSIFFFWSIGAKIRYPLYENRHGYRGPLEIEVSPELQCVMDGTFSLNVGLPVYYQEFARWDGEHDPNTGQGAIQGLVGISFHGREDLKTTLKVTFPIVKTALGSGDVFERNLMIHGTVNFEL